MSQLQFMQTSFGCIAVFEHRPKDNPAEDYLFTWYTGQTVMFSMLSDTNTVSSVGAANTKAEFTAVVKSHCALFETPSRMKRRGYVHQEHQ